MTKHIVVIGGGVMGLSVAGACATRGHPHRRRVVGADRADRHSRAVIERIVGIARITRAR